MSVFKDNNNREWNIKIDAPTIQAVRNELDVDLADLTGATVERLAEDVILLVNTLYVLCRSQAQAANISDEQFGEALIGDAIDRATAALLQAITDFFPSAKRQLLAKILKTNEAVRAKGIALAEAKLNDSTILDKISEAMAARLEDELTSALNQLSSATSLQESAA